MVEYHFVQKTGTGQRIAVASKDVGLEIEKNNNKYVYVVEKYNDIISSLDHFKERIEAVEKEYAFKNCNLIEVTIGNKKTRQPFAKYYFRGYAALEYIPYNDYHLLPKECFDRDNIILEDLYIISNKIVAFPGEHSQYDNMKGSLIL